MMLLKKVKMDNLEAIFDEVIDEANDGIKYNDIFIKFHTLDRCALNGTFTDVPILVIKNKKEIINKLKIYVDIVLKHKKLDNNKTNIKKCLSLLWANACYEDFSSPNLYIDNRINFYINDDFLTHDKEDNGIVIKKKVEPIYKETPYSFNAYIKIEDEKYYLPSINYGISNDTCYIYNIIPKENTYSLNGDYDVNLLALSVFTKELYEYGIGKIKVASCMPMRAKNNGLKEVLDKFCCMTSLFNNVKITSYPFESDEYMNINISEFDGKSKTNFNDLLI